MAYLYSVCHRKTYSICMQLACWWHRSALDVAARAQWQSEREGADSGSALFNRMIVDAGRGAGVSLALSAWLMGCCSSSQHIISALVCHVKYKHVEVSEAAPTPLYGAQGFLSRSPRYIYMRLHLSTWCIAGDPGGNVGNENISKQASFRCLTALKTGSWDWFTICALRQGEPLKG